MAMVYGAYSAAQTNLELIPAEAGKIIRVVMLLVSSWSSAKLTLISDPGGAAQADVTPPLHFGASHVNVTRLGRSHAVPAERGKALGITLSYQGLPAEASVMVWYELVD